MRKIPDRPVAEIVPADHPDARKGILHYRLLAMEQGLSLIEVRLETGRMHQIRLQASSRGWPVVGDWCYGATSRWGACDPEGRWQQLALHARSIEFRHPTRRPRKGRSSHRNGMAGVPTCDRSGHGRLAIEELIAGLEEWAG